ncbi:MAG: glycolate oxidase subunit GlcE [Acidiferrobacterales bacterium]
MIDKHDLAEQIQEKVRAAAAAATPLHIQGGNTKAFYGRETTGDVLDVSGHRGIVSYEPTELVITARAGTVLTEVEAILAEHGQMLAFEPPHFGEGTTLGGAVAAGLSGPSRPYVGAARDFVLGVACVNGRGERLSFGGQVMKNVAGYDVSRLMTGAMGTLGVLLEISLKVLPIRPAEMTLALPMDTDKAIETMSSWAAQPLPISGACYDGETLRVRLAGSGNGVQSAREKIGGDEDKDGKRYWIQLRDQGLPFFSDSGALWRVSVPAAAPKLALPGRTLLDWGGAQRWLLAAAAPEGVREAAMEMAGHAVLFRGGDRTGEVFHPLAPPLAIVHRRLKDAFDPKGIFNPGRIYKEL